VLPAASAAASAVWPRCLIRAKFRRCSWQIPVSPETSSSVKTFWLDRIVRLLIFNSTPACSQYGDGISQLCLLAIVLPFHYDDFLMNERSNAASGKKTYTPLAKPCNFRESWGKSKVNERAQNRNLLSKNQTYGNLKRGKSSSSKRVLRRLSRMHLPAARLALLRKSDRKSASPRAVLRTSSRRVPRYRELPLAIL
jgi:hypothetical protein